MGCSALAPVPAEGIAFHGEAYVQACFDAADCLLHVPTRALHAVPYHAAEAYTLVWRVHLGQQLVPADVDGCTDEGTYGIIGAQAGPPAATCARACVELPSGHPSHGEQFDCLGRLAKQGPVWQHRAWKAPAVQLLSRGGLRS